MTAGNLLALSAKPTDGRAVASPAAPKQGPFCVWHGLTFGNWLELLAQRPKIDAGHLLCAASITAVSLINSLECGLESLLFNRRLAKVELERPPIFILGHWRSGTTLLHNLMTLDPRFASPNLYQVLNSGHFLTTERLVAPLTGWLLPKTRVVDNMPAGWDMTQEDEIALLLRTGLSPYVMLLFQGDRSRYGRYFSLADVSSEKQRRWKQALSSFLKKLTYRHGGKRIVLKSPGHTFRIPLLLEMFPNAKFVYIHRDPYAIVVSSLHLRRRLYFENGLAAPNYDGLEEDVLVTLDDCIRTYERTKSLIPAGHLHELRFDRLESDLPGGMRSVYDGLDLDGWQQVEPAIRAQLPELTRHRKNSFKADEALRRRVFDRLRWIYELYDYPSGLDADEETQPLSIAG